VPERRTKRGADRTPLSGDYDVLVCGASFAGLAVARELAGSGARVMVIDRYEIGERQTSACAAPTAWLEALGLEASIRQTFFDIVVHRPGNGDRGPRSYRWSLPWSFSTFDYRQLCALLAAQGEFEFETAKVDGRTGLTVHTDRGDLSAPVVVDALGWRRVLSNGTRIQPPDARLSRGLEVHPKDPGAGAKDLELWLDPTYVKPGYSWSFPAGDEVRVGVGSFDPKVHVKQPTVQLAEDLGTGLGDEYQGNWIPHRLRPAVEDGVFFVGDSAGHCIPTTAEGIRTALYFGVAAGREIRKVVEGRQTVGQALERYGSFSDEHKWAFDWLWHVQTLVSGINDKPMMDTFLDFFTKRERLVKWSFTHYLNIAPPTFAAAGANVTAVEPWREPELARAA
jgi:menaquinone-9 beta-reductase